MNQIKMREKCKEKDCGHSADSHYQLVEPDSGKDGTECNIDNCECKEFKK